MSLNRGLSLNIWSLNRGSTVHHTLLVRCYCFRKLSEGLFTIYINEGGRGLPIFSANKYASLNKHMWLVGCPNPNKMEQSWERINKIRLKKNHHWTSKVPASLCGQSSLDGLDQPYMLACICEVQ